MSGKIFITYRRGDDPGNTGRLFDQLEDVFPRERLTVVDNIPPGLDSVRVLEELVAQCDVLLAVISKGWLDARDANGIRHLDKPDDFVCIAIASALAQGKLVIPVLLPDARMPHEDELPEAIRPLASRNAVWLAHERFKPDAQGLIRTIQQGLGQTSAPAPAQDDLAFRVYADHKARAKARQRRVLRVVGAVFGAIILVRLIFFFLPDLLIWLVVPDHSIRTFTGHSKDITSVAFSPDGRTALSGSLDNTARLWEVATGKQLLTFTGHAPVFPERAIDVVAFSPDGRTALSGRRTERTISNGDGLKLWDLETGKELQTFKLFHGPAAFSPNGRTVLSNGSDTMFGLDPKLKLWDVITGKELRTLRNSPAYVVAFLSDARTALSIDWDGNFTRWDAATGRELRTYKLRERMALWEYIHSVAFSPDGSTALIGSSEKTIKLWDLANGKELQSFTGSKYVPTVAFAPDGRTVVSSGSWHSSLKLWEVATGKELRTFSGHKGIVRAVALSPDGRTALSASEDTTLKLWDLTGP